MDCFLPEWLLALTLTLFIADIFLSTEVISFVGVFSMSVYLTWRIAPPLKWLILVYIIALLISGVFYYIFFRNVIGKFVRSIVQGRAPSETIERISGVEAPILIVAGRPMLRWNGDELWAIKNPPPDAHDGQMVKVRALKDGLVELD